MIDVIITMIKVIITIIWTSLLFRVSDWLSMPRDATDKNWCPGIRRPDIYFRFCPYRIISFSHLPCPSHYIKLSKYEIKMLHTPIYCQLLHCTVVKSEQNTKNQVKKTGGRSIDIPAKKLTSSGHSEVRTTSGGFLSKTFIQFWTSISRFTTIFFCIFLIAVAT
jgi:hypothetical protein